MLIESLTLGLLIVTAYYAYEVKKQTDLVRTQTQMVLDNAKKERFVKELDSVINPLIRMENLVKKNKIYWNWHNIIYIDKYKLESMGSAKEILDIIQNVMQYKYLCPKDLNFKINEFKASLEHLEDLRGTIPIIDASKMEDFLKSTDSKEAIRALTNAEERVFEASHIRFEEILGYLNY
jgi:hypothetical protein